MSRRASAGSALPQTLILLMLLVAIATQLAALLMRRATLTAKAIGFTQKSALALGVEHMVHACLSGSLVGASTCTPTSAQSACIPGSVEGRAVTVSFSGTPPQCAVVIEIDD